jgi:hypothetical protein
MSPSFLVTAAISSLSNPAKDPRDTHYAIVSAWANVSERRSYFEGFAKFLLTSSPLEPEEARAEVARQIESMYASVN